MRIARFSLATCCIVLVSVACADGSPSTGVQATQRPATHQALPPPDPDLADPLGQAMAETAQSEASGWEKVGKLWRGKLAARERQAFLSVLTYGHCYRFIGVGAGSVVDLDLALLDPNNVEVQRDVTEGAVTVLGKTVALCPADPGAYRIEARMRSGAGDFAIGLYRDVH